MLASESSPVASRLPRSPVRVSTWRSQVPARALVVPVAARGLEVRAISSEIPGPIASAAMLAADEVQRGGFSRTHFSARDQMVLGAHGAAFDHVILSLVRDGEESLPLRPPRAQHQNPDPVLSENSAVLKTKDLRRAQDISGTTAMALIRHHFLALGASI